MKEDLTDMEVNEKEMREDLKNTELAFELANENMKLAQLERDIKELRKSLNSNVQQKDQWKICQQEVEKLRIEVAGRTKEIECRVEEFKRKMVVSEDKLRKSENEYYKCKMSVDLMTSMKNDLTEYQKILEKSLLDFHREKMIEINKIILDTWQQIYEGNDIKTIEIKSTEESATGTKKSKSYNYRIVMQSRG